MDTNTIIGCVVIVCALVVVTGLVIWSHRSVDRIARNGFGSAREIDEQQHSGKR